VEKWAAAQSKKDICTANPRPLYPRKRTSSDNFGMSAKGQKWTWGGSFDHLVGGREQRSWHDEAESLGGFEVDRKLVFRRLLKR
jgi:hypothetical protein